MESEGTVVTWDAFKGKFFHKYFPADLRRKKEMEFLRLEQGDMSVGRYAAKFEELARFCPYSALEMDGRSKCSKFESGLRPKLKTMFGHQEIADFPTLVNKCRMYEDDLAAAEVVIPRVNHLRNFGPQRNHTQDKGKGKRFEDNRRPYEAPTSYRGRNDQGSKSSDIPSGGGSTPLCNKCGGFHYGRACPRQGTMVEWLPREVQGHQVLMIQLKNLYPSSDTLNDVPAGVNPIDGPAVISVLGFSLERENCRLGERGSPGRVKYWAILKDSRLSESGLAWARKVAFRTCRGCLVIPHTTSGRSSESPYHIGGGKSRNPWGAAIGSERGEKEMKIRFVKPSLYFYNWALLPRRETHDILIFQTRALSPGRYSLAQARISQHAQDFSRSSDAFLAWARLPEFPISKH
ncbi:hypothetical protein Lal_00039822 [Lupinus albus]|nr:hypothetical protein Lal_00039822 [Lupinus albus]